MNEPSVTIKLTTSEGKRIEHTVTIREGDASANSFFELPPKTRITAMDVDLKRGFDPNEDLPARYRTHIP